MVRMPRRVAWLAVGTAVLGAVTLCVSRSNAPALRPPSVSPVASTPPAPDDHPPPSAGDDSRARAFRIPSGLPPALSCDAARAVVAQARRQLAYPPEPVEDQSFAEAAADWLDPYGLWSVAPDTPIAASFERRASELLADLEGRAPRDCAAARLLGAELVAWVTELRGVFDEAVSQPDEGEDAHAAASSAAFEGATVTRPARALSSMLGRRIGAVERELGVAAHPYTERARARYFPTLDADGWAKVVLASAVRAYVPTIDPHGAWAPLDEESSVYEVDLEARPPSRLWDKSERTVLGVKIESGAAPPLADGDVVLSLANLPTAGLSFEQAEQLGFAACEARPPAQAVVLRPGQKLPVNMWLDAATSDTRAGASPQDDGDELPVERIEYGDGDAVVVAVHDVRDDLGDALTRAILKQRERPGRSIAGVVLDLRGNGGGSTDGAIDALGLFIAGAPLFPMRRRDGSLETDRAPEPPAVDRWRGPVASLVDGDTASAAEMIAGALAVYRRGPSIGATTFGKGCAQEYLDDEAHAGTLRLTTLLYALPDGTPVQRVGLSPSLRFPFGSVEPRDREAALLHAPPIWRGPDVRDRAVMAHTEDGTWGIAWPQHGGNIGPCKDPDVCRALRLLGTGAPTARRKPLSKGR
jgi:carboxyl-terminal processing protease